MRATSENNVIKNRLNKKKTVVASGDRPVCDRVCLPGRPVTKPSADRPVLHKHALDWDSTGSRPVMGLHTTGNTQPLGEG